MSSAWDRWQMLERLKQRRLEERELYLLGEYVDRALDQLHVPECACWDCVQWLNVWVRKTMAERIARRLR